MALNTFKCDYLKPLHFKGLNIYDTLQKRLLSDSEQNDSEKKDVKKKDGMVLLCD